MKKVTFTLFAAFLALSASAQLSTYNYAHAAGQQSGSTVIKIDTVHRVQVGGGGLPNFAPGNNITWDMSSVLYNVEKDYFDYDTSAVVAFPSAEYTSNFKYRLTQVLNYESNLKFAITPLSITSYGEHIDMQTFPLTIITGGPNDELSIVTQDITYSAPIITMPFPCVSGTTNWSTTTSYTTDMLLTYQAEGFNNQAVEKVSHVSRADTAVGYGEILAMRIDNNLGEPIDVIQIKNVTEVVDSFYSNNVMIPNSVLATFGMAQGQTSYVYQYSYYRAGEVTPMMTVIYDNPQFTSVYSISLHRQRIPFNAGVEKVANNSVVAVYPNPASSELNVTIKDKAITNCQYELLNVIGQSVTSGNASVKGDNINIKLTDIPTGSYFLRLSNNGAIFGQSAVMIAK